MELTKMSGEDSQNQILMSNVTLVSNEEEEAQVFKYKLNKVRTQRKIYEGSLRKPYERENKKGSIVLIFSDGAFKEVVLTAIDDLKNGPNTFRVQNEDVEKITIDPRKELTGKHIDTKIHFKVNGNKIIIHAYNSRQKLLVQGSKCEWFVDNYLEPYLKERIKKKMCEIENINNGVKEAIRPKQNKKTKKSESLEEHEERLKCDKCEYITRVAENLRRHIVEKHSTNIFQGINLESQIQQIQHLEPRCDEVQEPPVKDMNITKLYCNKCETTFSQQSELERHVELHSFADNLSQAFHICRSCEKPVDKRDLKIQCSKCIHMFHKRCTDRKDARGNWKLQTWSCKLCSPTSNVPAIAIDHQDFSRDNLNPDAVVFLPNNVEVAPKPTAKQPTFTGKHRKSKVNQTSPETEFLQTTVDTLKATVAMNEMEIKKLKESNDIKAKRILSLESQVQESRNHITSHKCPILENDSVTDKSNDTNDVYQKVKINSLENRTNAIEHCITILTSKMDNLQLNLVTKASEPSVCNTIRSQEILKIFCCESCEYETSEKCKLKEHVETHKLTSFKCQKCSYVAIHNKDLNRHDKTMHSQTEFPEVFGCNRCQYSTQHRDNLREHVQNTHTQQSRVFYSSFRKAYRERAYSAKQTNSDYPFNFEHSREKQKEESKSVNGSWTPKFNFRNSQDNNPKPISKCTSCAEKFHHEDELALHKEYFHGSTKNRINQQ